MSTKKEFLDLEGLKHFWSKVNALKANVNSPELTGTPVAPTAAQDTKTNQIATTKFVHDAIEGSGSKKTLVVVTIPGVVGVTCTLTGPEQRTYSGVTGNLGIAYIYVDAIGEYTIGYEADELIQFNTKTITIENLESVYTIQGKIKLYSTYGVSVDLNNSNPVTSVTYTQDAVGMTAGAEAWDQSSIFNKIKPCVLKNGEVAYYLNKNNYNLKENGEAADLTGTDGDVMVEFPKFAYKITSTVDALDVTISNDPEVIAREDYKYYAFTSQTEGDCDNFYWGAYKGSILPEADGVLRSVAGQLPAHTKTIGAFKSTAQANGEGYTISSYFQLVAIQCLYLIKYGSLNGQAAVGRGVCSTSAAIATGGTEELGMNGGDKSGNASHVKVFGIEDFWGNIFEWIDGLTTDSQRQIITKSGDQTFTTPSGLSNDSDGYVNKVSGTTESGFMPVSFQGSQTTYFCDYGFLYADRVLLFGGCWISGDYCGPFSLYAKYGASAANAYIGARLMYIKPKNAVAA